LNGPFWRDGDPDLRRKVDDEGMEELIHTMRGVGYRLGKEAQ
jgi:DNA-binding response OmpR family regulator